MYVVRGTTIFRKQYCVLPYYANNNKFPHNVISVGVNHSSV